MNAKNSYQEATAPVRETICGSLKDITANNKQSKKMGFGFSLFFVFILVPLTVIIMATWLQTRKKIFGKTLIIILLGISGLGVFI
ncbi:MAG: hypothetical protein K9H61_09660 [Bacteroidia bacterium]|nr:hypothetical protein [Bacteroidia bacterium]MCF8425143.1 hypothetical protein [Bacteroidia bacterium]MCF8447247.1 hypothetical protein [Bacteroidia bacterium]